MKRVSDLSRNENEKRWPCFCSDTPYVILGMNWIRSRFFFFSSIVTVIYLFVYWIVRLVLDSLFCRLRVFHITIKQIVIQYGLLVGLHKGIILFVHRQFSIRRPNLHQQFTRIVRYAKKKISKKKFSAVDLFADATQTRFGRVWWSSLMCTRVTSFVLISCRRYVALQAAASALVTTHK